MQFRLHWALEAKLMESNHRLFTSFLFGSHASELQSDTYKYIYVLVWNNVRFHLKMEKKQNATLVFIDILLLLKKKDISNVYIHIIYITKNCLEWFLGLVYLHILCKYIPFKCMFLQP